MISTNSFAQVHGIATAAGCQLVASCDLALAAEHGARFATSGINLGLFCHTPGVALARALSPKHAMELLFTGEFRSSSWAAQVGLVNASVPDEDLDRSVAMLAATIAAKDPLGIQRGKKIFNEHQSSDLVGAYALAGDAMASDMANHPRVEEGFRAFSSARKGPKS
jgi:enoyl-CoA hydratase/carnithine racemase